MMAGPSHRQASLHQHGGPRSDIYADPYVAFEKVWSAVREELLAGHVPQQKINAAKSLVVVGRLFLEVLVEIATKELFPSLDISSHLSFAAQFVFSYTGYRDFGQKNKELVPVYFDAIQKVLTEDLPELQEIPIDIWTAERSLSSLKHLGNIPLESLHKGHDPTEKESHFQQLLLTIGPCFGSPPSIPENFQPPTRHQRLQIASAMGRSSYVLHYRQDEILTRFFEAEEHALLCDCDRCRVFCGTFSNEEAKKMDVNTCKIVPKQATFDSLKRLFPEDSKELFAAIDATKSSFGYCLGSLTSFHIHLGESPITIAVLKALKKYYTDHTPASSRLGPMDHTENAKDFVLEDLRQLAEVGQTLLDGLTAAAKARWQVVKSLSLEQDKIVDDKSKSDHERLVAKVEKRRLKAEIDNVKMRILITKARMFNMENRYGFNPEMFAQMMLDHLKLPGGGKSEDPVGILKTISELVPAGSKDMPGLGFSMRQVLDNPMLLVRRFPGVFTDIPFCKPSNTVSFAPKRSTKFVPTMKLAAESLSSMIASQANATAIDSNVAEALNSKEGTSQGKSKSRNSVIKGKKLQKGRGSRGSKVDESIARSVLQNITQSKGKCGVKEENPTTRVDFWASSEHIVTEKGLGKGKEKGDCVNEDTKGHGGRHVWIEGTEKAKPVYPGDPNDPFELALMFNRHDQRMEQVSHLEVAMQENLEKVDKVQAANSLSVGTTSETTSKRLPVPPRFQFQGEAVRKEGIPKKIREAIWNLDFLLQEISNDKSEIADLYFRVATSLLIWSLRTDEGQWDLIKPRIYQLRTYREYAAKREMLQEEMMNACLETIKIVRFLNSRKGRSFGLLSLSYDASPIITTTTVIDGLRTKLLQFGASEIEVHKYWLTKIHTCIPLDPEALVEKIDRLRADVEKGAKAEEDAFRDGERGALASSSPSSSSPAGAKASMDKQWWEHVLDFKK